MTQIHKTFEKTIFLTHRQKENLCKHDNSFNIKFSKTQLSKVAVQIKIADNIMKTVTHSANKSFTTVKRKSNNISSRFKDMKKKNLFLYINPNNLK